MVASSGTWQAPGPGMWEMDEAHQSAPYSTYLAELYKAFVNQGIGEAGERYGTLIERFDVRSLDGWMFVRPRAVGAPEKPGPMPPRWLFKLLFKLHPALRRRARGAAEAVATRRWREDAEWWLREGRETMRARLRGLQAVDLAALSDAQLAAHLSGVEAAALEGARIHFRNAIAHWIGVGDWLASASEWTGVSPEEALFALQGSSPFSMDAVPYLERIAAAVRESSEATSALMGSGDPASRLAEMRSSSPAVAEALDDYLDEHGWRIYTGFDIADKALHELPGNLLDSIVAQLEQQGARPADTAMAASLRERVPPAHVAEYDALLETARVLYGVRDDDAGICIHWTCGLLRRVLLEASNRLATRGYLEAPEHLFDATPEEAMALLQRGAGVTGAELARRAANRQVSAGQRPPSRLGEDEGPPPPDDWMPSAVARVNRALMTAMAVEYVPPVEDARVGNGSTLKGLAASRGAYEGRACLVEGPDDFAKLRKGDILVVAFTTTAYNVVLPMLGGVVTDKGGVLSHAAIVAREYGIPAVVNTGNGTSVIRDGSIIRVDGAEGTVTVVDAASGAAERQVVRAK